MTDAVSQRVKYSLLSKKNKKKIKKITLHSLTDATQGLNKQTR